MGWRGGGGRLHIIHDTCMVKYTSKHRIIEIIDIECVLLSFLSDKYLSPQNGGFIRVLDQFQTHERDNFARLHGV